MNPTLYVVNISTDASAFIEGSPVRLRLKEMSKECARLAMIISLPRPDVQARKEYSVVQVGSLVLYPVYYSDKIAGFFSTLGRGTKMVQEIILEAGKHQGKVMITAQDPFFSGLIAHFLAKKFTLPLQLQIHTDIFSPYFARSFGGRLRRLLAKFLLPHAKCIRVVSERIRASLPLSQQMKTDILPVYTELASQKEQSTASLIQPAFDLRQRYTQFDLRILMVGRLETEKDFPTAFQALKMVQEKNPRVGMIVAGEGSLRKSLETLAESLCPGGIIFEGRFKGTSEELSSYYASADIFLLTSRYEGFALVLLEAASAGCPIITSDVGLVGDILKNEHGVMVCTPGNVSAFAEAIQEMIDKGQEKRHRIGQVLQDVARGRIPTKEDYFKRYHALLLKVVEG